MNRIEAELYLRRRARIKWIAFWCVGAYVCFLLAALLEGFLR